MKYSKYTLSLLLCVFLLLSCVDDSTMEQEVDTCLNSENIVEFQSEGKRYELVMERKTWVGASNCAVSRGGYLVEINNSQEQNAVFSALTNNISDPSQLIVTDGDGSYVWIGGTDIATEGTWLWDGDFDGVGEHFWEGNAMGNAIDGRYNNWGLEPDNFNGQNALGMAITSWTNGQAGQWNDIQGGNSLFFVIEYN